MSEGVGGSTSSEIPSSDSRASSDIESFDTSMEDYICQVWLDDKSRKESGGSEENETSGELQDFDRVADIKPPGLKRCDEPVPEPDGCDSGDKEPVAVDSCASGDVEMPSASQRLQTHRSDVERAISNQMVRCGICHTTSTVDEYNETHLMFIACGRSDGMSNLKEFFR